MFVRAEEGKGSRIIYHRNDGGKLIKIGGSPAWRNNNPGNVIKSPFARENGSIGYANKFAVFPDYETGRKAMARLLRGGKYRELSVFDAVAAYAPAKDKNNVVNYRKLLKQFTKLDISRKYKSLNADEFQLVLNAIQRIEGWTPGKEEIIEPAKIDSVRRDRKGVIVAYRISGKGWLSKAQLIALIDSEGGIDAVVVHSSTRASYIRMRPDSVRPNNLNKRA